MLNLRVKVTVNGHPQTTNWNLVIWVTAAGAGYCVLQGVTPVMGCDSINYSGKSELPLRRPIKLVGTDFLQWDTGRGGWWDISSNATPGMLTLGLKAKFLGLGFGISWPWTLLPGQKSQGHLPIMQYRTEFQHFSHQVLVIGRGVVGLLIYFIALHYHQ